MSATWLLSAALVISAASPLRATAQDGADAADHQFRARVTFENDRVFTGLLSVDDEGELLFDCDVLGGEVIIDFPAVAKIERLTQDDQVESVRSGVQGPLGSGEKDTISMLAGQLAIGTLEGIGDESVTFASEIFGTLTIPRTEVGDLFPGRPQGALAANGDAANAGGDGASRPRKDAWSPWNVIGPRPSLITDGAAAVLEGRRTAITRKKDLVGHRISVELEWQGLPEFRIRFGGEMKEHPARSSEDKPTFSPTGGTVMQPWSRTPTLYAGTVPEIQDESAQDDAGGSDAGPAQGELRLAQATGSLSLDAASIFHFLVKDEGTLVFESIEGANGARSTINIEFPLAAPVDRITIESLGRPLTVLGIEMRDPNQLVDADGLMHLDRPLRGGELVGFDAKTGRLQVTDGEVEFPMCLGVAFMPRDRRDEMNPNRRSRELGQFRARSGETLHASQVLLDQGSFAVKSAYLVAPTRVPFESIQSLTMPKRRVVRGGANFKMSFDGEAQIEAGFHGISSDEGGYRVLRSEPGFKTTVAGPVAGQVWIERSTRSLFHASRRTYPHDVLLADGQTFPASIVSVDETSIRLATPFADEPLDLLQSDVKALMFDPRRADFLLSELTVEPRRKQDPNMAFLIQTNGEAVKKDKTLVTKQKLRRALLVPRAQKDKPGTHLLIAKNGDLMRGKIVGREDDSLLVETSAGGTVEVPLERLAICVGVERAAVEGDDPRERKIKTTRSGGQWTVNLGPRATLIGDIEKANSKSLVLRHPLLGRIEVSSDEFKRLDFGRGFAPKFRKILDWQTEDMPEPKIGG